MTDRTRAAGNVTPRRRMAAEVTCEMLVTPTEGCPETAAHRVIIGRKTYRCCASHARAAHDKGYETKEGIGAF